MSRHPEAQVYLPFAGSLPTMRNCASPGAIVRAASLDGLSAHGLHKSAPVRLAEDGHSDHEIMAMGGWKTLKEVSRYTKGICRKRLAENVLKKDQGG